MRDTSRSSKRRARECDTVVASVFVNPTQFGDPADLDAYPRDEANDARIAAEAGVDYLFVPALGRDVPARGRDAGRDRGSGLGLEGEFRPGHFRGVATVCLKLFLIVASTAGVLRPEGCPAGRGRSRRWCTI